MIVYSDQAATAAGGGIGAQVQYAVDRANLAYANSGIATRLRLVHSGPAGYSESGDFSTDLNRLTNVGDGYMNNVDALRNTYAADVVSLFIENAAYCGLGYVYSDASTAFTVVNRGCSGGNLSLAHEVGHNFGALHDPYVDPDTIPYAYGHGYVYLPGLWRTVMAYDNQCVAAGSSCTRIAYFSNPNVAYNGVATGTAATHHNARVLNDRASTLANFRAASTVTAPTVSTGAATAITSSGATLNGTVSSNGAGATASFQYGVGNYGSTTAATPGSLPANASNQSVSATVAGLTCGTTYQFRVVAGNSAGTTSGNGQSFTTAACSNAAASTTLLTSAANPAIAGTNVLLQATVTGSAPTGTVSFRDNGTVIAGCATIALNGSGNVKNAFCIAAALAAGTHSLSATYAGDASNQPSTAAAVDQLMITGGSLTCTVTANPYGTLTVTGGSLVGSTLTLNPPTSTVQLGTTAGNDNHAQFDCAGLHWPAGATLTLRSGAAGQMVVLKNINGQPSAIAGSIVAQGGNGAAAPQLYLWNGNGIALGATADVVAPSGLTLDALSTWTAGGALTNAGNADGGAFLVVTGSNIKGGGSFRGNEVDLHTFGTANNPVAGAHYLDNSLQVYPGSGTDVALLVNTYGNAPQFVNVKINGNGVLWMPSAWPASFTMPANSAPQPPGTTRPAGAGEPAYGGGSIILQSTGSMTLHQGGGGDLVFPGGLVLKAGTTLDLNGVVLNQGWTTTGRAFQGIYLEAPVITSATPVQILSNDLNWTNFSVQPSGHFAISRLKAQPNGTASYAAADGEAASQHLLDADRRLRQPAVLDLPHQLPGDQRAIATAVSSPARRRARAQSIRSYAGSVRNSTNVSLLTRSAKIFAASSYLPRP